MSDQSERGKPDSVSSRESVALLMVCPNGLPVNTPTHIPKGRLYTLTHNTESSNQPAQTDEACNDITDGAAGEKKRVGAGLDEAFIGFGD